MTDAQPEEASAFGRALRAHRTTRGLSQLALAVRVGTPQRHLSFLETGRARPKAELVTRLSAALGLSLREHNQLLEQAGLPHAHRERRLSERAMQPFLQVLEHMLEQHAPFPGLIIDGRWDVVDLNPPARRFLARLEAAPANMVEAIFRPGPMRAAIENWPEVATAAFRRLEREAPRGRQDPEHAALLETAARALAEAGLEAPREDELVVSPTFRLGDTTVRTFSLISCLGAPQDVTLDELRLELLFPRDPESDAALRRLTA